MNNSLNTPRDIRLSLASMLDMLDKIQTSDSWGAVTTDHPLLNEQYQQAKTAVDDLWFRFRCATTNPGD